MALITKQEKNKLYLHIKHELGYPLRPFALKDEMLDSYLEMVVEDYSSLLNNWLIQQQWVSLEGLDKNLSDFTVAYTTKSNDYMKSFTYAYSKQVGLGTNAPAGVGWELKRDYITVEPNIQHYLIPAGREVNEVLWETPPAIDGGMVDPFALTFLGAGNGGGASMYSSPARYVQPIYSTLLMAQDRRMKQRMLQSILTYRITGLETGEKMLHLYPVPGGRSEIKPGWLNSMAGRSVWYFYYETNNQNRKKCLKDNPDIVRLPSDSPSSVLEWSNLNDVARQQIRSLLIAKVKMALGNIYGFYSGALASSSEVLLQMDYRHLLDEGIKLKEDTEKLILDGLDKLSQVNLTEDRAKIAASVNQSLGYQPFKTPIIPI